MSGVSPGRGHPGRGSSPSKAQASRPTLGENSQALSVVVNPKVNIVERNSQHGNTSSTRKEDKEMEVSKAKKETAVTSVSKKCVVKQSASQGIQHGGQTSDSQKESPVGRVRQIQPGAQEVRRSAVHAAQVQLTPPAHRQRRTSLERQTLQENLQQRDMVTSMACSGRTRSQSGGGCNNITEKCVDVAPGKAAGKSPGGGKTVVATSHGECASTSSGVTCHRPAESRQPERAPRAQGNETARAPELQLAEEIPILVRKMEELLQHKHMLQMQIDCVYKLKTANPQYKTMHDTKLYSLSLELAGVVKEIDCVMERMGPLAESYKNKERFANYGLSCESESRSEAKSGSDISPDEAQQVTRPILQAASFSFKEGDIYKSGKEQQQLQKPAAVSEQELIANVPAQAPQVPEGTAPQQDSGLMSIYPGDGVMEQSSNAGTHNTCDNVPEGSVAGGGAQSVWDGELCDQDIEVDNTVHNNVTDFPPLPTSTPVMSGPTTADSNPVPQDSETRQIPPRNAWSRGAPSMAASANYTGQAFKRRNVVRFRHRGDKEDLPDRRFVVRELLCHQMGFVPADILAVINLPDRQGYDVSFKLMSNLDRFWSSFPKFREKEGWSKFSFIPISKPDTVIVNIIFWNEAVPPQDIVVWLRRHCDLVSDLTKNRDDDGIWTGGWKVLVKLRQHGNITQHLPNSFFIGRERGVCFYPGQLRKCFKCGKAGHVASVCTVVKCSLCGETGHVGADCRNVRCNLCGKIGHPHRDCPDAWHNICRGFPDEVLVAVADAVEEEAMMSGEILTRKEVQEGLGSTEPQHSESAQGDMEVVPQDQQQPEVAPSVAPSVSGEYETQQSKRKKKNKSSRRPEGEPNTGQNAKKRVNNKAGVMTVSNRYEVLSESEGDFEEELKRIEDECEGDVEDHPPTKRKPPAVEAGAESDMETGLGQQDVDSDL